MATTITRNTDSASTSPVTVLPWVEQVEFGNVLHEIPGRPDGQPDVTLRAARTASGEMRLLYSNHAEAHAALELHRAASLFIVSTDEMDWMPAAYVPVGIGRLEQDARAIVPWVVTIGWREVAL